MKIDRLMGILLHLLRHGKTSAAQLAEKYEVTVRTIMRDIDTLCQAGIPIASVYGANGGYEILDTYILDKHFASDYDYQNILTALRSMASAYENKAIQETIQKIELLSGNEESVMTLDLGAAHENMGSNLLIQHLEKAIMDKRRVAFSYTNSQNVTHEVIAEPVGVIYKWYNWYLIGYSMEHHGYRMYKLVRMEQLSVTEQAIAGVHSLKKVMDEWTDTQKSIEIKAVGNAQIKAKCREYLNIEITRELGNGDFEFRFFAPETETFWFGVLLSFGNQVQILEPQSVIDKIMHICEELSERYH